MSAFSKDTWINGLWKQNPGLVQLLGLCPILAVSTTMVNAVSLGVATIVVMALANLSVATLRNFIPYEIRIPVFILIIASLVTVVDLLFNAYLHELYLVLGSFIPLISTHLANTWGLGIFIGEALIIDVITALTLLPLLR